MIQPRCLRTVIRLSSSPCETLANLGMKMDEVNDGQVMHVFCPGCLYVCCSSTSKVSVTEGNCEAVKLLRTQMDVYTCKTILLAQLPRVAARCPLQWEELINRRFPHHGTTPDQLPPCRTGRVSNLDLQSGKKNRFGFGYMTHSPPSDGFCRNWPAENPEKNLDEITITPERRDEA